MDSHGLLFNYLWIAPHVFQAVIATLMIRRGLSHQFPIFLSYLAFELAQNAVLVISYLLPKDSVEAYTHVYVAGMIGSITLRFGILYEIFRQVFRAYPGVEELGKTILRWGGAILLLVGVGVAASAPANNGSPIMAGLRIANLAVSVVQSGLLVLLFLFSSSLGLSLRSFVFGIAAGMGLFSTMDLATTAVRAVLPETIVAHTVDIVTMATYHVCVLVWLFYLLLPAPEIGLFKALSETNLDRWNAELERLLLR